MISGLGLSVATLSNAEIPNPLMAFGNHIDRVRLYEATPDITGFETEVLKITEWLRLFFDNVLREALENSCVEELSDLTRITRTLASSIFTFPRLPDSIV